MNRRPFRLFSLLLTLVLLVSACSPTQKSLVVFAAASLKEPFAALAKTFEDSHPGVKVTLQTGGSSTLATQIVEGAPVDLFASAGPAPMETVKKANLAGDVTTFASNQLVLITPKDNPKAMKSIADAARPGVKVVICQTDVPCGTVTQTVLKKAGITLTPVSLEKDVTAVLTKVRMGEADAGFVYVTDAKLAGGDVAQVDDPIFAENRTTYPMTIPTSAKDAKLAREFADLVLSDKGQQVLAEAGFGKP